jgi:hypothetical protein
VIAGGLGWFRGYGVHAAFMSLELNAAQLNVPGGGRRASAEGNTSHISTTSTVCVAS